MFFAFVLLKVIAVIDAADDCYHLILQAWYLDDGMLAGPKHAVLFIIEDLGPSLGIFINSSKCVNFSQCDVSMFFPAMKVSHLRHMCVCGAPIGDYLYCTGFIATLNLKMLLLLTPDGFNLLRLCSGFCRMVHLLCQVNLPPQAWLLILRRCLTIMLDDAS